MVQWGWKSSLGVLEGQSDQAGKWPSHPTGSLGNFGSSLWAPSPASQGPSSIWAGDVWEGILVFRKKLPEENLYMEKMSEEGVIRSMSCFPCSLPWHHLHLRREQTTSCCVPVLLHCTYLTIHGDGLLRDTWNTVLEKNRKLQIGLKTPLSSILIPVPF